MTDGNLIPSSPNKNPDNFLKKFSNTFVKASTAFQLQDIDKLQEAVQQASTLNKQVESYKDPFVSLQAEVYLLGCKFYLNLLRYSQFAIEGRLDKAMDNFSECRIISDQGVCTICRFDSTQQDVQMFRLNFGYVFKIFTIYLSGLEHIVHADMARKTGRIFSESRAFSEAASILKTIEDIDYIDIPFIVSLRTMIRKYAQLFSVRADMLKLEEENIRFIIPTEKKVFLVHGHHENALRDLATLLFEKFGLEVIVLKDKATESETVIEKFEKQAKNCGYAIAMLTTDDIVENKETKYFQARPNVLFELGWFCGRFGRKRTCIVTKKGVKLPSDLGGVICLEFENAIAEIEIALRQELQAAGLLGDVAVLAGRQS